MVRKDFLSFYQNKKVLVTGHTGFKGSWLSFILDDLGSIVKGYSLDPSTNPSLFNNISFSNRFNSVIGDIRDEINFTNEILDFSPDIIFHLAAQPLVIKSYQNPRETFDTNFTGTMNLLEALKKTNRECTVVIITTDKVYENKNKKIPFKENDKLGGDDPYSASKAASEILINSYTKSFFSDNRIKISSARAGNVIGGGDWAENRLVPDIIRSLFEDKELSIRNPLYVRPWQHVIEPLIGYMSLAEKLHNNPLKFSGSWNFGPTNDQIKTVDELIKEITNNNLNLNINYQTNEIKESSYLALDISKSINELSWRPKWNFKDTICKTINWYTEFYNGKNINTLIKSDIESYLN